MTSTATGAAPAAPRRKPRLTDEQITATVRAWNPLLDGRIERLLAERERLVAANAAPYRIGEIDTQVAALELRRERVYG